MSKKKEPNEEIIFRVATLFFEGRSVREIAEQVNTELRPDKPLNRESVYPLLAERGDYGSCGWWHPSRAGWPPRLPGSSPAIPNTSPSSVRKGSTSTATSRTSRRRLPWT